MKRNQRLHSPADFARVREASPRVWAHPLLVLYVASNDLDHARVGITVSGRVGKAVVRNKVRRRIREALRTRPVGLAAGNDLVVIARPRSAAASWTELNVALDSVLGRAGATARPSGGV